MSVQTKVGYQDFAEWEKRMVRMKAERLVRSDQAGFPNQRAGLTRSDIPDLEHEMLIQIHIKRGLFDPSHHSGASFKNFVGFALDKFAENLLRDRKRLKRGGRSESVFLDKEIESEEGDTAFIGEMITDEYWPHQPGPTPGMTRTLGARQPESSLRLDTNRLLGRLNSRQREIGRRIMEGHEMTEIGPILGISRAQLYREITEMRKTLYAEGLRDYMG